MFHLLAILLPLLGSWAGISAPPDPPTAADSYVEFDFGPLPEDVGRKWSLALTLATTQVDTVYVDRVGPVSGYLERFGLCEALAAGMKKSGFKAEVVDKSKIRVYGRTHEGKFYSALAGGVESGELKKGELPKVKNPPKP